MLSKYNKELRFISGNKYKIAEVKEILSELNINIIPIKLKIEELQTENMKRLIKDKTLKAFKKITRPLFIEHTGIYLKNMNNLPGGLTQIFWDTLEADKFSELFGNTEDSSVTAITIIGYTDGEKIYYFDGKISGKISKKPRGSRDFQWDCVFIPNGLAQTFAELGKKKNEISMRKKALYKFAKFLLKGEDDL